MLIHEFSLEYWIKKEEKNNSIYPLKKNNNHITTYNKIPKNSCRSIDQKEIIIIFQYNTQVKVKS